MREQTEITALIDYLKHIYHLNMRLQSAWYHVCRDNTEFVGYTYKNDLHARFLNITDKSTADVIIELETL